MRSLICLKPTGTSFRFPTCHKHRGHLPLRRGHLATSRPTPLRPRSASPQRTLPGPAEACLRSRPPVRSLLWPGEGRLQGALLLSKRYKQPVHRENHPPAELSARTLDPRDTAVSVESEGLEADLDSYRPLVAATDRYYRLFKFFLNSFLSEKGLAIAKHWPSKSECFHFQAPVRFYTLNLARGSTSEG